MFPFIWGREHLSVSGRGSSTPARPLLSPHCPWWYWVVPGISQAKDKTPNFKFRGFPQISPRFYDSLEQVTSRGESTVLTITALLEQKNALENQPNEGFGFAFQVWEVSNCEARHPSPQSPDTVNPPSHAI